MGCEKSFSILKYINKKILYKYIGSGYFGKFHADGCQERFF